MLINQRKIYTEFIFTDREFQVKNTDLNPKNVADLKYNELTDIAR